MEIDEETSRHVYIGFPLGLGLLVTLMLFICCFFCCCLHWEKLQSLFLSSSGSGSSSGFINPQAQMQTDLASSHQKPVLPVLMKKQNETQSLPVLMPGDEVPKFMAVACPCKQYPTDEIITIIQSAHMKAPPTPTPTAPN